MQNKVPCQEKIVQTAQGNELPAKAQNLWFITPKYIFMPMLMSVPSQRQVLVSLVTNKKVNMLSQNVNITVYSIHIFWCKLWLRFWWEWLKMHKAALFLYGTYKVTHYCTWEIDCKRSDGIDIYAFTFCSVNNWRSVSFLIQRRRVFYGTKEKIQYYTPAYNQTYTYNPMWGKIQQCRTQDWVRF